MHDDIRPSYPALWLSVSPHLQRFDDRLIQQLAQSSPLYQWEYQQTMDEPCSIEVALTLLHDYLKHRAAPVHLIGHGISGIVGLIYAHRHPRHVASLTLLSVGANPAITWHSHYYALRKLLPCRRSIVLLQLARLLFGAYSADVLLALASKLEKDLDQSLTFHSLTQQTSLTVGTIESPLLVCQGDQDVILDPNTQTQWRQQLKEGDRFWHCPEGKHFFQYDYPKLVATEILDYWQQVEAYSHVFAQAA